MCSFVLLAIVLLTCVAGCASTSVATVWKSPDPAPPAFTKVLALVVNASPAERRAGEDELVRSIKVPAVAAYTLVPDEDTTSKDKIRTDIEGHGFDGAAVIRLVASDKKTTYVPPKYGSLHDPFDYPNAYSSVRPGYTTTDTTITAEASLYSIRDKKLLWAGSTTTTNPSSIRDLIAQVCRSSADELRRQGLLR
jgi:hypothetical protein